MRILRYLAVVLLFSSLSSMGFCPSRQCRRLRTVPLSSSSCLPSSLHPPVRLSGSRPPRRFLHLGARGGGSDSSSDEEEDDDEEDAIDLSDQDWRSFRAKLVMGGATTTTSSSKDKTKSSTTESKSSEAVIEEDGDLDGIGAIFAETSSTSNAPPSSTRRVQREQLLQGMTPLDPSQWAYDSGKVIEQGAVILGGVEQDFGFGLRQQYFHKAAILVLDHQDLVFTKGIILNRPTDLTLDDDINPGLKWRIWFGGDVQGLDSPMPDIVCLHSLRDQAAVDVSETVMKDIQWTTFDEAKKLVKDGVAEPKDFWVFCGYAGWGPRQLMGELDRKTWYMVATDSQTLLKELARLADGADPRDAGLDTWTLLMNMIGKGETAEEYSGEFDDLMLKEWALQNLLSTQAGGGAGKKRRSGLASTQEMLRSNPVDRLLKRVAAATRGEDVTEGTLVRATDVERSPFLLDSQELHKSLVLVISDDENMTVGAMLNRPSSRGIELMLASRETGQESRITIPIRFGGPFTIRGQKPLLWLHCSPILRSAKVGTPMSPKPGSIWKCTEEDMKQSISQGLVPPEAFVVVTGLTVWTKGEKGLARGIQGEIRLGKFEIVPEEKHEAIWNVLEKQQVLTKMNLVQTLALADKAWSLGASSTTKPSDASEESSVPMEGLGEGFDEENDTLVFKSDVKVSELSDDALRAWVATFLLAAPTLGT